MWKRSILALMIIPLLNFIDVYGSQGKKRESTSPPAGIVQTDNGDIIVTGAEDPEMDASNVQWAVNNSRQGSKIYLKGTFRFDDPVDEHLVLIDTPHGVEIVGEWDSAKNEPKTRIIGGRTPFFIGRKQGKPFPGFSEHPDDYPCRVSKPWLYDPDYREDDYWIPVKATIKNISFVNPFIAGIQVCATSGVTIQNCHFLDARRVDLSCIGVHPESWGIIIAGYNLFPSVEAGSPEETPKTGISGSIKITDCRFLGKNRAGGYPADGNLPSGYHEETVITGFEEDGSPLRDTYYVEDCALYYDYSHQELPQPYVNWITGGYKSGMYLGIVTLWTAANYEIARNEISGVDGGIVILENAGIVRIHDNCIETPYVNHFSSILSSPIYVSDSYFPRPTFAEFGISETIVYNNSIKTVRSEEHSFQWSGRAITFTALSSATAWGNHIETEGGFGYGFGLNRHNENCNLICNTITGKGKAAIGLFGENINNDILGNNTERFRASQSHLAILDGPEEMDWGRPASNFILLNTFGPDEPEEANTVAIIEGDGNFLLKNTFKRSEVPGSGEGINFLALTEKSHDNFVLEVEEDSPPSDKICGQIEDNGVDNLIFGCD
ncbi:MAG: hypothetical protein ACE5OP_11805 [Candidatus Glassbacteria bacterium]